MNRILILSGFLLLRSCSLLDLRDPEEPSFTRSSFVQPALPEDVPENLRFAYSEGNKENFRKCLGDPANPESYRFIPSPELQTQIPGFSPEEEVSSFSNLMLNLLPREKMTVQWLNAKMENQIDSARWTADYQLFIPRSGSDFPSFIDGRIQLHLRKDASGFWTIYRWRDFSLSGNYCWSQLKWRFVR